MSRSLALSTLSTLLAVAYAQQIGTNTAEVHPALTWQTCKTGGTCTTVSGSITLDANWRWVHTTTGYTNCYTGNTWDATICPDPVTCAKNCALDGAAYGSTYGITTSGNALTLALKTGTNIGSRVYLMASNTAYEMFHPKNQEFTFDVDVSQLGCGLNGAVYFSEMAADGGMSTAPNNKAGAQYGTGYCDSQCPHDIKFINGEANSLNWTGTSTNSGKGMYGSCCNEMDIWEANKYDTAYTPHGCATDGLYRCSGTACTGQCDQAGCDFNSYRMGNTSFFGPGMIVDSTKKVTVVTQFLTSDGTSSGALSEIRRLYVQNGVVIQNSAVNIPGMAAYNSVTDAFCAAQKTAFGDTNSFESLGGFKPMSTAMTNGMVLVLSIWDDYAAYMLWLDSVYPVGGDTTKPGVVRGSCATSSGLPADVESQQASASVTYSNIKFGDIGSTYSGGSAVTTTPSHSSTTTKPGSTSTTTKGTTTTTASGATQTHYGQCGGTGWTGPTVCASPYTCKASSVYYSQCL